MNDKETRYVYDLREFTLRAFPTILRMSLEKGYDYDEAAKRAILAGRALARAFSGLYDAGQLDELTHDVVGYQPLD